MYAIQNEHFQSLSSHNELAVISFLEDSWMTKRKTKLVKCKSFMRILSFDFDSFVVWEIRNESSRIKVSFEWVMPFGLRAEKLGQINRIGWNEIIINQNMKWVQVYLLLATSICSSFRCHSLFWVVIIAFRWIAHKAYSKKKSITF